MLRITWLPRAHRALLLGVAFLMIAALPAAACPPDKAELTLYKEIVFNANHRIRRSGTSRSQLPQEACGGS